MPSVIKYCVVPSFNEAAFLEHDGSSLYVTADLMDTLEDAVKLCARLPRCKHSYYRIYAVEVMYSDSEEHDFDMHVRDRVY